MASDLDDDWLIDDNLEWWLPRIDDDRIDRSVTDTDGRTGGRTNIGFLSDPTQTAPSGQKYFKKSEESRSRCFFNRRFATK